METILKTLPPRPLWPDGITHRSFIPGQDEPATFAMMNEAFQDDWRHLFGTLQAWKETMMKQEDFDSSLWILTFDETMLVRAVLCWSLSIGKGWVDNLAARCSGDVEDVEMARLLFALVHAIGEAYHVFCLVSTLKIRPEQPSPMSMQECIELGNTLSIKKR